MLRKTTLMALAATAALGLLAATADFASARGHGHGGGHGGGARGHHGHGHHGHHGRGHRHGHRHHHHRRHWHVRWHRHYHVRPYTYGYYAANPVLPGPCTCLSKEYTPEGAVLFKDRCTNEMAMNPPALPPQQTGALDQPQSPYAQQYVQPQPQAR